MIELLTAAQMKTVEKRAIETGQVTGLQLMERAGFGTVAALLEEWPDLAAAQHKALVLCGPGNNGGDGFVVARLLNEMGWPVEVYMYGDPARLPPDAKVNYERWRAKKDVAPFGSGPRLNGNVVLVDALFGIGQNRPLPSGIQGFAARAAKQAGSGTTRRVAIDVPSGIDSDTGHPFGEFQLFSDLTVTFHRKKPCHADEQGLQRCGKVVVKGIGLDDTGPEMSSPEV